MIFLRINCPDFIGLVWRGIAAAIPNFRLAWQPPYLQYCFWCHCLQGVLVAVQVSAMSTTRLPGFKKALLAIV